MPLAPEAGCTSGRAASASAVEAAAADQAGLVVIAGDGWRPRRGRAGGPRSAGLAGIGLDPPWGARNVPGATAIIRWRPARLGAGAEEVDAGGVAYCPIALRR